MKSFIFVLALNLVVPSFALAHEHHAEEVKTPLPPVSSESVYNLNEVWTDQTGLRVPIPDLRGKPSFVVMAYTRCEHACPLLIEDMKKVARALPSDKRKGFSFYLFSLDSKHDTPKRLKGFAAKRKLDSDSWRLFTSSDKSVRALAAVLNIKYKKTSAGDFDHTNVITLLDKNGQVIYQHQGLNQDPAPLVEKALTTIGK